jgi:hypothetical protein
MRRGVLTGAVAGLALGTLVPPSLARAQAHPAPPPLAAAARRVGPITLDGKLDEPDWQTARPAENFTQAQPDEGKPATQRTEVRFLYDDEALYIGARMFDTQGAAGIRTRLVRRDDSFNSDYVEIIFDTYHDHQGRVEFMTNPSGSKEDSYGPNGANLDPAWDAVWEVKARIDSLGWTAEFRIPLSQLRFPRDSVQTWGLQVWRFETRLNEISQWSFWHLNESGGPARFGHLEGLRFTRGPGKAEVLPYTVGRSTNLGAPEAGDPFHKAHQYDARLGADFKYLVTSNLTLAGTVSPDFGQVEVDPAVVNLSAFETYFPEKRPFFVEGAGMFGFGGFNCFFCSNVSSISLFYPRRIGRSPQGAANAYALGTFADVPDNTQILGAAKLTGQVAPGWTLATLDALTAREMAPVQDGTGQRFNVQVEPATNYFVGHLSRDLPGGNFIRGMFTSVVRSLGDSTLRTQLNSHSEAAGLETNIWWGKRTYRLMSHVAVSQISGDSADVLGKERSSARYFQRPDRRNGSNGLFTNAYDSSLRAMRGYAFYTRLAKDAGDWLWEASTMVKSPGFEANDVAFNSQADRIWMNGNLMRQYTKPTALMRSSVFLVGGQEAYNFSHDLVDRQAQAFAQLTFLNYWNLSAFYIFRPNRLDDQVTRGGPVVARATQHYVSLGLNTDSRKWLVLGTQPDYYCADARCSWDLYLDAVIKPSSNLQLELTPSYSDYRTRNQYVTAVADPRATLFFGQRYVFADLHEKTLAMDTRLNITFTPELTFQLYAQPLIASGSYTNFKEYNQPRALERSAYGVDRGTIALASGTYTVDPDGAGPARPFTFSDPNFNFRSLRGSAVLRWEYHPGATLYVVWTQNRSASAPVGDFEFGRDIRGLFDTPADNIFLVKVSYWLAI